MDGFWDPFSVAGVGLDPPKIDFLDPFSVAGVGLTPQKSSPDPVFDIKSTPDPCFEAKNRPQTPVLDLKIDPRPLFWTTFDLGFDIFSLDFDGFYGFS